MRAQPPAADGMRAVFNASPVPTAITRLADGKILLANPACLKMLGWQETEFVGKTMLEVGFWARPDRRASMLALLHSDEGVRDLEEEVKTKSGETRLVLTSISLVELEGEQCLVGQLHDITERRRLETQLSESDDRFRQLTETLQQAILLSSIDPPVVLYASPAVELVFGIDRQTLYENPTAVQSLIHPDDAEHTLGNRSAMSVATDFEYRIIRPDGETRWIRSRAKAVRNEGGRLTRVASISEDVTEERQLRETLRESEERFRLLAENSTDVITRSSPEAVLQYVSPASRVVYGYEPDELVGRAGWEFIHPDDLAALRDDLASRAGRPDDVTNEYRVRRKDGTYAWVEAKSHTVRDPTGQVTEIHTSARDVSERRRAEDAIRRAKDEAEEANQAKSEFLSRMSHELRTPLHAILGFGELLGRDDMPAEQREQLTQLMKGGRHLLDLINEVLDISQIERGELRLSLEPVHVGHVIQETLGMVGPLAAARSLVIRTPVDRDLDFHVLADHQRLKQVLLNLLSNALKYNRTGGGVRIGAARSSPLARIEVVDNGVGIAADSLARVFEAFVRLGAEGTDVEGTGLGLALTKRLIETMGGVIGVKSEIGRGTTFWFELPVVALPAEAPSTASDDESPAPRARGPARTVLYVEDNPSNIMLVRRILTKRPEIALLVAERGALGLELAREHRPTLVLLDLNLPDISGETVLRQIRGHASTADLAVVVVSADATPGQITLLRQAGADDYLTKPFDIAQFLAVIDDWAVTRTGAD